PLTSHVSSFESPGGLPSPDGDSRAASLKNLLSVFAFERNRFPASGEKVVILLPVYGGKRYLKSFFANLLADTTLPFYLMIVDNGNDDPTISAFLKAIAAAHDNITLLKLDRH